MIAFVAANMTQGVGIGRRGTVRALGGSGAPIAQLLRGQGAEAWALDEDEALFAELTEGGVTGAAVLQGAARAGQLEGVEGALPFKPSPSLERAAAQLGLRLLAAPAKLVRQLENKLSLPELAAAAGVTIPGSETVALDAEFVERAQQGDVAFPIVLQPAMGFAGAGTRILRSPADVADAVAGSRKRGAVGKLAELVAGEPVTVNGVVGATDMPLVGGVTRQLTGVAELTPSELGSCGNDWSARLEPAVEQRVRELAHAVGEETARRGFRGAFGIDAVVRDGGEPVLIELNPRWTGSLSFQVQLHEAAGAPTLLDAHLAAFDAAPEVDVAALEAAFGLHAVPPPIAPAATVIAYAHEAHVHAEPLAPGTWRLAAGVLERTGDGLLPAPGRVVLLPQPPARAVARGSELARMLFADPVSSAPHQLLPEPAQFVQEALAALQPNRPAAAIHR